MTLPEMVAIAVGVRGDVVVREPDVLLAYALDLMDHESVELRVLMRNCDEDMLAPVAAQYAGTCSVDEASARIEAYLVNECVVAPDISRRVARGLAEGVAAVCGDGVGERNGGGDPQATAEPTNKDPSSDVAQDEACHGGIADGVVYELDARPVHASEVGSVVWLHNKRDETVKVIVTSINKRGGHPKKVVKNIHAHGVAVAVFPAPLLAVESVGVESTRGRSPDRRLMYTAVRRLMYSVDSVDKYNNVDMCILNVTKANIRVKHVDVVDETDRAMVLHMTVKRDIAPSEHFYLRCRIPKGHEFGVYVNGVKISMTRLLAKGRNHDDGYSHASTSSNKHGSDSATGNGAQWKGPNVGSGSDGGKAAQDKTHGTPSRNDTTQPQVSNNSYKTTKHKNSQQPPLSLSQMLPFDIVFITLIVTLGLIVQAVNNKNNHDELVATIVEEVGADSDAEEFADAIVGAVDEAFDTSEQHASAYFGNATVDTNFAKACMNGLDVELKASTFSLSSDAQTATIKVAVTVVSLVDAYEEYTSSASHGSDEALQHVCDRLWDDAYCQSHKVGPEEVELALMYVPDEDAWHVDDESVNQLVVKAQNMMHFAEVVEDARKPTD